MLPAVYKCIGIFLHRKLETKGLSDNDYCQLQTINLQGPLIRCKAILNIQDSERFILCVAISQVLKYELSVSGI